MNSSRCLYSGYPITWRELLRPLGLKAYCYLDYLCAALVMSAHFTMRMRLYIFLICDMYIVFLYIYDLSSFCRLWNKQKTIVIEIYVQSLIRNLKPRSAGWYSIPALVLKSAEWASLNPLTHLLNLLLTTGVSPRDEIARVILLVQNACGYIIYSETCL